MNCSNHNHTPAIGICKHCNKGVCLDCLNDTGDGLACKGRCTDEVILINDLINRSKKSRSNWTSSGVLYILIGVLFLFTGAFYFRKIDLFLIASGILFMLFGIYEFYKRRSHNAN